MPKLPLSQYRVLGMAHLCGLRLAIKMPTIGGMDTAIRRGKADAILVADDFAGWRAQVRSLLEARPEWQVIREAVDGLQAVEMTRELHPDIVILDIGMPVLNSVEAAKQIRQGSPRSRIIFATQNDDADVRREALAAGAVGYLLKTNAASDLLLAIELALKNGHYPHGHFHHDP